MKEIMCDKCKLPLEKAKTSFRYLNHELHADILKCPSCGQVFVSEEMVKDKIQKVEMSLEDK
jgi:hypothetical protein